ncbi:MAG: phosphatase PAP2 family protein, partial [Patescibacteria group bacterium]|nr:phosphatase PAP2 family protein [Patescibacteria group bacterium]
MKLRKISTARYLPIEFYVLLLPSIVIFITLLIINAPFVSIIEHFFMAQSINAIIYGDKILLSVFFVMAVYITMKVVVSAWRAMYILAKNGSRSWAKESVIKGTISVSRSAVFVFLTYSLTSVVLVALLLQIFGAVSFVNVVKSTITLTNIDSLIFGGYLPSVIHSLSRIPYLEQAIVRSYLSLVIITPVILALLFLFNRRLFRKFTISFFLVFLIALPFWQLIPAVSPSAMYRFNLFQVPIPPNIESSMVKYPISPYLKNNIISIEDDFINPSYRSIAVSTFPSMHAAWAMIVAYYGTILFWPLGVLLVPWAIFNSFGAIYVEQHYGVDVIFGVLVAVTAIISVSYLLKVEEKYFNDKYNLFAVIDMANTDMRNLLRKANNLHARLHMWIRQS